MELRNLPLTQPRPCIDEFVDCILGRRPIGRVPLVEYIVDPAVMRPICTDLLGLPWVEAPSDQASWGRCWDNFIAFWHGLGYDFVRLELGLPFPQAGVLGDDPTMVSGQRGWWDEHTGAITNWEEFEAYPWPDPAEADLSALEYIVEHLPEGMGLVTCHGGGIYEHLSGILSYEGLAYLLVDDRDLVQAVSDRVGEAILGFYRRMLELPKLRVVLQGDDMGFRTGTLIAPDDLRAFALPWHKRFAEATHGAGIPYCLHSCGRVMPIMDDLIDDVGIDGKHSFEDVIMPVTEFHAAYGDRIAALGGIDVDFLCRASLEAIRERVRATKAALGPKGRYALGSGNSIPSYVPVDHYLTMVDEALAPL